ncbi:MAG: FkbM family methyltransferase [Candidatus Jettenia sp.]|nr:MAG: FkbM family methyltransferase [Candidatus Jettenia sp.]
MDKSEIALDIGANMGQMTCLMRYMAGKNGKVISFEPHPELFPELFYNTTMLNRSCEYSAIELHNIALSNQDGEAFLDIGIKNRGESKIISPDEAINNNKVAKVQLKTLDNILGEKVTIGLCKIDVEGHELNVFKGAIKLLGERRIRDIVFEDWNLYPSNVHKILQDYGFTLFTLLTKLPGPCLVPLSRETAHLKKNRYGSDYLATLDSKRAIDRFKRRGWFVLKGIHRR